MDDNYLTLLMEQAEEIKTSGRQKAINDQIVRLANDANLRHSFYGGPENDWMFHLFSSLCAQVFEEYLALKAAYDNTNKNTSAEISWRSRNLFELSIWAGYCSSSTERARQFYDDAARDLHGIADALLKWGEATAQDADWIQEMSDGKEILKTKASIHGAQSIDSKYKRVQDAAKEIGFEHHYKLTNLLLSKFTHPTSAVVMRPPGFTEMTRTPFFAQGCLYYCNAINILEIWILGAKEERG